MKKLISMLLAVSVIGTMAVGLAGCNGGSKADTLVWVQLGEKPADHDKVMEKVNEIIEPELGMKLEIQYIDSASFNEKTKLKMASGEKFDLIFTGYVNNYQNAVDMGGLYDITDMLDNIQMSDGTVAKMSDAVEQYYIDTATVAGRVYGIPNAQVISNPSVFQMHESVVKDTGVDMEALQEAGINNKNAQTAQAYADLITKELAKIAEKRPDLYTMQPSNPICDNIYEGLLGGIVLRKDGSSSELLIEAETEEWMIARQATRKWYELGYIRSDMASAVDPASNKEELAKYGMQYQTWKPGQNEQEYKEIGENMIYAFKQNPYVGRTQALLTMISVGANTKHPEEAVKLIYMMNSNKELFNTLVWGIEGTHYTLNEDGSATIIEGSGYDDIPATAWRYGNQFNSLVMDTQPADVWEQTQKMNDEAIKSPALGFVPDQTNISAELANLSNVGAEYKAKINYGTSPVEEWYDDYIADLKTAGIEKVRDELQKQYDEFLANK